MKQFKYINLRSILILTICIFGLGLMSCNAKKEVNKVTEQTENKYQQDWVKLTRSGCFGTCPVYNVTIYGNGIVKYEGVRFTDKIGMFIGHIDPALFEGIVKEVNASNFMEMKDVYKAIVSDLPSATVLLHLGDTEKQVIENGDAPRELKLLQKYLDGIVSSIKEWKEVMRK